MRADKVEVSWDGTKSKWLVRIVIGEEVIRRSCDLPLTANQQDLRMEAQKVLHDEGYEFDGAAITVQQARVA